MTAFPGLSAYGIKDLDKFFVGFDDTFNRLAKFHDDVTKNIPNYPPYNIKKVDENKYVIELAVAGFSKQELELELAEGVLTVRGQSNLDSFTQDDVNQSFLYKGISDRTFTRKFTLADTIEIKNAEYFNGMLKVFLERIIPEHKKPRKIEILSSDTEKKLLVEDNKAP
jgi:molecular chaperone IbpA